MAQINTLLELRSKIKNKKPIFIRQDNPKRPKLGDNWRKPKGVHSKIRHHFKGRRKMPSPGWKSPAEVRGLHATGLEMIRVFSPEDINKIRKDTQGIIIPKAVGKRKRIGILKKAREMNIRVLNLNIDQSIKKIEDFMSSKRKKEAKAAGKEPVKEAKKQEEQKAPVEAKEAAGEDKKEAEKKERDKVLTKKV